MVRHPYPQRLSIGKQAGIMRQLFPNFKYKRRRNLLTWIGTLKPRCQSPEYVIRIEYRFRKSSPKVFVLEPEIKENVPHRYKDGSLCLYYPKDGSWSSTEPIATVIIPWIVEWLILYEVWLVTDEWFGQEAPHNPNK